MSGQNIATPIELDLNDLQPNPLQPRAGMDQASLDDLVASIKKHGILEPIVVAHTPAGYQIIAGERRWKAAHQAGLKKVPVVVRETDARGMLEMAIIENVQRVDLNPIDRAKAFQRLVEDHSLTIAEIADRIGKSAAYVSNTLRLLTLPELLLDGLLSEAITEGHARALMSIEDTRAMVEAYKIVLKESASVRRAEEISRRVKVMTGQPISGMGKSSPFLMSPIVDQWQKRLQSFFGQNARVKLSRSRVQTKVVFVFSGSPDQTQQQLNRILKIAKVPTRIPSGKSEEYAKEVEQLSTGEMSLGSED